MMKLKEVNKVLSAIATELKQSAAVYSRAAQSVNERIVTDELNMIAERRKKFMNQIADELDKHQEGNVSIDAKIDFQRNVELVLGDLLIRKNVPLILKACMKSDQKLINLYSTHLEHEPLRDASRILLNEQYNSILEVQREFRDKIDKYPWFQG